MSWQYTFDYDRLIGTGKAIAAAPPAVHSPAVTKPSAAPDSVWSAGSDRGGRKMTKCFVAVVAFVIVMVGGALTSDDAFAKKKDRQPSREFSDIDAAAASLMGQPTTSPGRKSSDDKDYWRSQKKLENMYLGRAKKLAQKKNYSEALSIIRSAIIKFGYDPDLHKAEDDYSMELANREISDDAAIKILDRVLEWDPQNQRATSLLAARLRNKGIEISSFDQRVAYARQLVGSGDNETAIRELEAALHIKYDDQIYQAVGQLRRRAEATRLINDWLVEVNRESTAETHFKLGQAYELAGDLDKAMYEYQTSAGLDPRYKPAADAMYKLDQVNRTRR